MLTDITKFTAQVHAMNNHREVRGMLEMECAKARYNGDIIRVTLLEAQVAILTHVIFTKGAEQ